jgi:hypothetical protein
VNQEQHFECPVCYSGEYGSHPLDTPKPTLFKCISCGFCFSEPRQYLSSSVEQGNERRFRQTFKRSPSS